MTVHAHTLIAQEAPCSFTEHQGGRGLLLTELLGK